MNIRQTATLGLEVAKLGVYPVIPHTNTGSVFIGTLTEEFWYEGTLELLSRCDAMILVPGWEDSKGATAEVRYAKDFGIPVFERVDELREWIKNTLPIFRPTTEVGISYIIFDENLPDCILPKDGDRHSSPAFASRPL